jgi:4-amino-4-deoxy-L-arabinose transferase-like glycosyltransferase
MVIIPSAQCNPKAVWFVGGLIVCVSIAFRVAFALSLDSHVLKWGDEQAYDQIAWHLAQTGAYESDPYRANPLMPAFLAGVYKVVGHDYRAARIVQCFTGGLLVAALFCFAKTFFGHRVAILSGILAAIYPPLIYLSSVFYGEHLLAVLAALGLCLLAQWQVKTGWHFLVGAGLLAGAAVLCRPVFLLFVPLAGGYVFTQARPGTRARSAAVFMGIAALVVLPWTARNYAVYHRFMLVSSGFGQHFWMGNNELSAGDEDDRFLCVGCAAWEPRLQHVSDPVRRSQIAAEGAALKARLDAVPRENQDSVYIPLAVHYISNHPGRFLKLCGRRLITLYSPLTTPNSSPELANARNKWIVAVAFYPILGFGLIGAALAWRCQPASWIGLMPVIAITIPHTLLIACSRFRWPSDICWMVFASLALVSAGDWIRRRWSVA